MFSQADRNLMQQKGISLEQVNHQINFFKHGIPFLNIVKTAIAGDGILVPGTNEVKELVAAYDLQKKDKTVLKFVPASGAATRMFKSMFEQLSQAAGITIAPDVAQCMNNLESFAFYDDLREVISKKGLDISVLLNTSAYNEVIDYLLNPEGLNYGALPKGLLKFHKYEDGNRTSVEEHLVEGAMYAKNDDRTVKIHFTVSPEHLHAFHSLIGSVQEMYEKALSVQYKISFSIQKLSTDTIAVDGNNEPFRDKHDDLVFRPGGHGALLDNLNDLDADVIFIKNIDNVVPDRLKNETVTYKKVLGGMLLQLQSKIFGYMIQMEQTEAPDEKLYQEIEKFIQSHLGYKFSSTSGNPDEKKQLLLSVLNRPIRVCGMVKNTGEPGGGPFWVKNEDGSLSLQILESSQFNLKDTNHDQIFKSATHFNPVDLVITTKNYKGEKFDLKQFRDLNTGFISRKSKDGKELKALELPGLWNGAMAFWNTVFMEVPAVTFNPVKSINDLLRPEHQNK
jgi:hypothetical protein